MANSDKDRLSFAHDGRDWPHRDASRFVEVGDLRWHLQRFGAPLADGKPVILLLHGTGAATHSWRDVAPELSRDHTVLSVDLPGHGFSDPLPRGQLSLPGMARALQALLTHLNVTPTIVVGHSAGAAVLARMVIDQAAIGAPTPKLLVSLNGAFLPFEGWAGHLFPPMAKLLFLNPFAPRLFAWSADEPAARRLLEGTGSKIDALGVKLYARLFGNAAHVAGALGMMANWDLELLVRDLAKLTIPVALVSASYDRAVPPEAAKTVAARLPNAEVTLLRALGHLAHEEQPELVADCDSYFCTY